MRDYGKVHGTFWSSPTTGALSANGKLLALYLMTCTHSTIAGVFRLPDGYVAEDLQWPVATVQEGFAELSSKGFANRCETTKWVWVAKHLDWNPPENPNQRKAVAKMVGAVPDECAWKGLFLQVYGPSLGLQEPDWPEQSGNGCETLSKPETVTGTEAGTEAEAGTEDCAVGAEQPGKAMGIAFLIAQGVERKHAEDWLKARKAKRAPLTQTAWDDLVAEAAKAGVTPPVAVRIAASQSWQGFKASWLDKQRTGADAKKSFRERDFDLAADRMRELSSDRVAATRGAHRACDVVDMETANALALGDD